MITSDQQGAPADTAPRTVGQRVGEIAATMVACLHNLRLLQIDLDDMDAAASPNKAILADSASFIRRALGTKEYMGLLDLLGIEHYEGWLPGAVIDGYYDDGVQPRVAIWRADRDKDSLYSSKELTEQESTFWHKSSVGVVTHLCAALGYAPGGSYAFAPVEGAAPTASREEE